ncbi:MAG: HAMP domain-containing histidine kinase [Eubacterium sp.]|nr:HAMP domain-containing histidine kinase [Eubacterium sp.]
MIKRLRIKYTVLAVSALFLLLTIIVAGMNLLNYRSVIDEADETLAVLSDNSGVFPSFENGMDWLPSGMSREIPFESRYFSVLLDKNNTPILIETSNIYSIDGVAAVRYAVEAAEGNDEKGFKDDYRYIVTSERIGKRITFLDCGRKIALFHEFRNTSIMIALAGYFVILLLVCFFVARFTRPVSESYEKQKRFITDAGHEIKTPLTIINADVDILKMDAEENEYLDDIKKQSNRLAELTNDLIKLARMEESKSNIQLIDIPASEIILETATSFQTIARSQNKEIVIQVQPMLTLLGDKSQVEHLITILLDNAIKYSPSGEAIKLGFVKHGKKLVLSVSNTSSVGLSADDIRHVFDRFYRADQSRNSETGGHGIGLSIAQAIVDIHGGKIGAASPDGNTFVITASFPARNI